jgi:predicted DsbA family dithiol-disulfide isomerase
MAPTERSPVTLDVVSDVVCPWCYIGKRQLDTVLAAMPADERPVVRWHPFQLNPDLPTSGIDRRGYLEAKFGGPERAAQIYERVRQAGRGVGIEFDFDAIAMQPNTFDAHRLIEWVQHQSSADGPSGPSGQAADAGADPGRVNDFVERLFRAYFLEGRFIGARPVLAAVAGESGFDAEAALAMLESDWGASETAGREDEARRIGVSGVPFFIFDRRLAVSGAQGADALRDAHAQARADG